MSKALGYVSLLMVLLNVGFGAAIASLPSGTASPWLLAVVAGLNAIVHALPSQGISVVTSGSVNPPPPPAAGS